MTLAEINIHKLHTWYTAVHVSCNNDVSSCNCLLQIILEITCTGKK